MALRAMRLTRLTTLTKLWRYLHGGGWHVPVSATPTSASSFLVLLTAVAVVVLPASVLASAAAGVKTYSVYTPLPIPSDFSYRPEPGQGQGTFSPYGHVVHHMHTPQPHPHGHGNGFIPVAAGGGGGGGGRTVSPSLLATTRYVVPPPPGFKPGRAMPPRPHPLSHHVNYHNPGHVPRAPPHLRSRHPPPPMPPPGYVYRHGRQNPPTPTQNNAEQSQPMWIPSNGNGHGIGHGHKAAVGVGVDVSTIRPPPPVTSYISFDQYPSTSTSTSVVTSKSTTTSKVPMMVPAAAVASSAAAGKTSTTTTTTPSTAPSGPSETVDSFGARKRRKGKRRTTTTTTSSTTSTSSPIQLKETPEFQVPNPNYDYDDPDYVNNVLKRSPDAEADPDPQAGSGSAPATVTPGPFRLSSSLPSSSARPTLLHRIELSDLARIRARAKSKAAAAKATKTKSQHLWAIRTASDDEHGHRGEDEIKKVISTELRKTHLSEASQNQESDSDGGTPSPPIWRVTRVETSMNYSDSADGRPVNKLTVLPYDGGAQFESMRANRPTVNYVDLVTGESFNPFANSSPPITGDLYNSDGKSERKQIQHQLIYNDDTDLRQGSKLPENKTVDFEDTLSYLPQEVPVEPDFKKTRLRLKKKHPLLNQDSIITAEQSVTKNGLMISTDSVWGSQNRTSTTPMTVTSTRSTTTFRPYTTSRIILTTRKPSSFTTEILNSWNSPTRTSTYATTTVRPTQSQVTTRRNPATTPAFTTSAPTVTSTARRTPPTRGTTTTTSTTTTTEAPYSSTDSGLLDLFTLLGQTNTNSETDGSTTQANLFGFGDFAGFGGQNQNQQSSVSDLQAQLTLLDSLLGGGNQFSNLFTTTTEGTTSTSTSTTTQHPKSTNTASNPANTAPLSDSEIKSFLNILGVSTSTPPSADGVPNNIQAVLEQQEQATPAPTLSTHFVAPSPIPQTTRPPLFVTQAPRPHSQPTPVPSLSAALSNMLAVLSNPFAPPPATTTVAPPLQSNSLNNADATLLAALLSPQNGGNGNGNGLANGNGAASDNQSLLSQLLQLGNALDPNGGAQSQSTRQVEVTPSATVPPTTTPRPFVAVPTTRVPTLFDFSSLLSGFGGAGLGQPTTTATTTSNPLAALLDLNRLLFRNNNNNNNAGATNLFGSNGNGNGLGFGNLFGGGGGGLFGQSQSQQTTTASPFGNLFNFNSLLNPGGGRGSGFRLNSLTDSSTHTHTEAPQPIHIAAGNAPIEFHIQTTKRPSHPGPYMWLDMNTFFGGGAGPNDGVRPKIGSRDPFIKV